MCNCVFNNGNHEFVVTDVPADGTHVPEYLTDVTRARNDISVDKCFRGTVVT